ncbi:hypothetical protein TREMEDRAFT_68880 [Tremella mesenterica DSM 1558]|uniref:uncharacterized protein n=1 Tax=Tremella mesenterica (strain ATCC 24925 / CBS 8224 / DSM 1558 / NBRC 9311 / NRRL Y-6157 / RJB 2259-6 / UBC 559-6) TaxID=578456 RepID=UPI0003F497B0|nr:uncharacterized protein TREMEDRAFT_68880 [Tremella mesenterica DSM 1558]EIW68951.1 hypothetical protein TREMEDRAFT_68880 [Tremella mesenterica DSM 1558]
MGGFLIRAGCEWRRVSEGPSLSGGTIYITGRPIRTEEERAERKRRKKGAEDREEDRLQVVEDDYDAGMWVEKSIDGTEAISNIPTAESLLLTSHQASTKDPLHPVVASSSERESWMLEPTNTAPPIPDTGIARDTPHSASNGLTDGYGEETSNDRTFSNDVDFFSDLGKVHERKNPKEAEAEASRTRAERYELNTQLKEGKNVDEYEEKGPKKVQPGGPGYQWRMMKLKKLYEQATEQSRDVEDVAMERYGSLDEFHEAVEERRIIDEREQRRQSRRGGGSEGFGTPSTTGVRTPDAGGRRFMFTSEDTFGSRPSSRAGFRRPGEAGQEFKTPGGVGRVDAIRRTESTFTPAKVTTPIPSVFTPQNLTDPKTNFPFPDTKDPTSSEPPLSIEQLNRLQAKVLRAKLSDDPKAVELEEEYDKERRRFERGGGDQGGEGMWTGSSNGIQGQMGRVDENGTRTEVQVLPTLDGRGRLYDVGMGKEDDENVRPGNRRKKPERFETRDKEGNLLRYNADDDELSLGELVRQEKFGAGSREQKEFDAQMAMNIARDAKFENDLDYMDDNADRLARRKMKSDAMKRQFAINDYARTKKALDECPFCYQEDRQPLTAVVALGTRTYLCCTMTEELVEGHCLIVPLQHHLSSLEMDDDEWEEVRNFMKCLMRMHAKENKGVLFYETILSFRQQRHTFIEAVPLPYDQFQDAPAYFRESILASESEWSQHKKLIDFSSRPGGFRRCLVSNIPYFMVHWDYKGEKGYGHVIEGTEEGGVEDGIPANEGDRGGTSFPPMNEEDVYFASEIIGNLLELEPRKWRNPRKIDFVLNKQRAKELGTWFQPYNWTTQLEQTT